MKKFLPIAAIAMAATLPALVLSTAAEAHAHLTKSDPAAGATVVSPKTIRMEFSEGIEISFSGIDLLDAAGKTMATQNARLAGGNNKVLLVDLPPLQPGTYQVKWHNVAVDTHKLDGTYSFTVKK